MAMPDTSIAEPRAADRILAAARDVLEPALRAAVDTLPELMRLIAGYHLGWWDAEGSPVRRPAPGERGKALRPALALLCGEAVGGHPESALPPAVAVELVHNFSLLHDDVMAGAPVRRRRPAAWTVFGTAQTILAGDSLLVAGMEVLAADRTRTSEAALHDLVSTLQDLCAGQSAGLRSRSGPIGDRTGALLGCSCAMGALYGGGGPERARLLRMFGERLAGTRDGAAACLDAALPAPETRSGLLSLAAAFAG